MAKFLIIEVNTQHDDIHTASHNSTHSDISVEAFKEVYSNEYGFELEYPDHIQVHSDYVSYYDHEDDSNEGIDFGVSRHKMILI
jgi:hypothetical protein